MYLILGLGNPGFRYRRTRHNIGFMVLDYLAKKGHCRFQAKKLFKIVETDLQGDNIFLVKPFTYMNRSGLAVNALLEKHTVRRSQMLILCDDLNLPLGKFRIRKKGSHGGQKGLSSIIDVLRDESFPRLRLGIGFNHKEDAASYVLSPFLLRERRTVRAMIISASQAVEDFVLHGVDWTMNKYN